MSCIRSIILAIPVCLFALCLFSSAAFAQDRGRINTGDINGRVSLDDIDTANTAANAADAGDGSASRFILDYDEVKDADVTPSTETADNDSVVKGHGLQLAITALGVPDGIFDKWFSSHGSTWDGVVNLGFSLDYFLRFRAPCELRFSMSWINARTGSAYWLDEKYEDRPYLADYIINNYHVLSLEVAAYHVISIIDEIAFYYGGGGWGGVILGEAHGHPIRSSCAEANGVSNKCPHEPESITLEQMPDFFGFVVVTLGFKFTVFDIMTIRAEGGFKGYLYGQVGLGVEF